jgi:hypothetical protein
MITVTAKSFIGGFDPLNEGPPMHQKDQSQVSVLRNLLFCVNYGGSE